VSGGRGPRQKGSRAEREAVAILQAAGIAAERIPLSGAAGGSFVGDITAPVLGIDRRLECKCRAAGFATIYRWLAGHYGLLLRADRSQPRIVLRLQDFAELAIRADEDRERP
jgi:Holliday junction resolvase